MGRRKGKLFNGEISVAEINHWLQQFEDSEQIYINKLLSNFTYYDSNRVRKAVASLNEKILAKSGFSISEMWFVPVGYVTKSGSVIAYYYRSVNGLEEGRFISSNDILRIVNKKNIAIVFIDDYIGTGHQAKQVWEYVIKPHIESFSGSKFFYCTLVGTEEGINFIKKNTRFEIVVDKVIHNNELPFHKESKVFASEDERSKAEEIVRKYGNILYPGNPLGYKNSQALIGFFYSTPNNTLPIFWSINEKWHPLLPRNESYRDPKNLIGSIAGLSNQIITPEPQRAFYEISKLEEYDVSSDFISKGISEFQKLPNILVLIQPMKQLGFSEDVFVKIISLIGQLKRNIHEREPVKASILLINQNQQLREIGDYYVKTEGLNISNINEIRTLVGMTHSYNNTIVINNRGEILGLLNLFDQESSNSFLPNEYKRILCATKSTGGLAVLSNGDDRVSILFSGERILLYRGASWSISSSNLNSTVLNFSMTYGIDYDRLRKIFETVFRMSYIGKGALITIGDEETVKKYCEEPIVKFVKHLDLDVQTMSTDAIIGIMEQDGATIINNDGKLIQAMTFLRPPSDAPGAVEMNKGSKHSTAAKISAMTNALVIAVSVDGRITFYKSGHVLIKMMG